MLGLRAVALAGEHSLGLAHLRGVMDHCVWLLGVLVLDGVHLGRVVVVRLVHSGWHLVSKRVSHGNRLLLSLVSCSNHVLIVGYGWAIVVNLVLLYQLLKSLLIDRLVHKVAMTLVIDGPLVYFNG